MTRKDATPDGLPRYTAPEQKNGDLNQTFASYQQN